ncbi:MAG: hypothetical protein GXP15_00370 [Gammaproteobacteria bacterium]|nr:hypothetical protein [Gammaproteobacteria bacterium]
MPTDMSRTRLRKRLLIVVILAIVLIVGFTQLPLRTQGRIVEILTLGDWPLEWAVRRQFALKQPELHSILNFLNEAPEVASLTVTPVGLRASLQQNEAEKHDLYKPNILQALISIDAQLVNIDEDQVSVFLGSEVRGSTHFEMSYVYHEYELDLINCDGIAARDRAKIGSCGFSLSPDWYASYQWYPDDTDELEKMLEELR